MRAQITIATSREDVTIIRDATPADIEAHAISLGLASIVRSATIRRRLLRDLAADPAARVTLAVAGGEIVGQMTVGPSFGRWRTLPRVREVGFEVAKEWRRLGLVTRLIEETMAEPEVEEEIILGFLWPAAWDLADGPASHAGYREMLTRIAGRGDFHVMGTDEPELVFQQGASLVVRIGARVPSHAVDAFNRARYAKRHRERVAS